MFHHDSKIQFFFYLCQYLRWCSMSFLYLDAILIYFLFGLWLLFCCFYSVCLIALHVEPIKQYIRILKNIFNRSTKWHSIRLRPVHDGFSITLTIELTCCRLKKKKEKKNNFRHEQISIFPENRVYQMRTWTLWWAPWITETCVRM